MTRHALLPPHRNMSTAVATLPPVAPSVTLHHSTPFEVDRSLYRENRVRLAAALGAALSSAGQDSSRGLILLQGGSDQARGNTDCEELFLQDKYFLWAFGENQPGMWGAIALGAEAGVDASALFVPRLPAEYAVWMGDTPPPAHCTTGPGGVSHAAFVDELPSYLEQQKAASSGESPLPVFVLSGTNSDSGAHLAPLPLPVGVDAAAVKLDTSALYPVFDECRVFKSEKELAVMRYMNAVASAGHVAVMAGAAPGQLERHAETMFDFITSSLGPSRYWAYTPICAAGRHASVLHYGHAGACNDATLQDGQLLLCDMGKELVGYASDITVTFPVNGKFSDDQKMVYEAVLAALNAVERAMKPGVSWPAMQDLAYRTILTALKAGGVVTGNLEDMMAANVGAIFMPHGLGHLIGLVTHDVGGYPKGTTRDTRFGHKSLRCARNLEAGMTITVEPGCYFIPALLEPALAEAAGNTGVTGVVAPGAGAFIVADVARRMVSTVGGVRLEDNVAVSADGIEVFTKVPRAVEDVEAVCQGKRSW